MDRNPDNNESKKNAQIGEVKSNDFLSEMESSTGDDPEVLLDQAIPNLAKEMKQLQSDFIGLNAEIESIEFGEESQNLSQTAPSFKSKLIKIKKKITQRFTSLILKLYYRVKYIFIWLIFEFPKKLLKLWSFISKKINLFFEIFRQWSGKRKAFFLISLISLFAASFFYLKLLKSNLLAQEDYHFYGSMEELADYSFSYSLESETEPFYNSPRVKVYSFKMRPIVVNLKRVGSDNENPMAYIEFIFIGNSGDVVVELKERESEFIDAVERTVENSTYESLDTIEGKAELKLDLIKEINKRLLDGVVKKIELHNLFIKP